MFFFSIILNFLWYFLVLSTLNDVWNCPVVFKIFWKGRHEKVMKLNQTEQNEKDWCFDLFITSAGGVFILQKLNHSLWEQHDLNNIIISYWYHPWSIYVCQRNVNGRSHQQHIEDLKMSNRQGGSGVSEDVWCEWRFELNIGLATLSDLQIILEIREQSKCQYTSLIG